MATASICALTLFGCGGGGNAPTATMFRPAGPGSGVVDDSEALRAQDAHAIKVEITVCAPVKKLLPDDTRGLPHEKFLLELSNGTTLLVAHDTAMAPRVPLAVGVLMRHGAPEAGIENMVLDDARRKLDPLSGLGRPVAQHKVVPRNIARLSLRRRIFSTVLWRMVIDGPRETLFP